MGVKKKKTRILKRQVRKTLGVVFLASAVAVAAIPTGSLDGGNVSASITTDADGTQKYTHVVEDSWKDGTDTSKHSETYPITTTATAHSVYVNYYDVGTGSASSSSTYVATASIPMCKTGSDTTIYSTGDGDFQFAYVTAEGDEDGTGPKVAVILGYSHSGSIEGNTVTIPNTVDAYLNYNDNNGSNLGFVAVGKSGNYLFYKTEEVTSYYTTENIDQIKTDADNNPKYKVTVTDATGNETQLELSKPQIEENNSGDGFLVGKKFTVDYTEIHETVTVYTYYSPCYYSKESEWKKDANTDVDLYYYPTDNYKPNGSTDPVRANVQAFERIANANVTYIGNQYLKTSSSGWEIAGTVTKPEQGIFAGNSNIVNLVVGDKLSGIGDYAFYGCVNLKSFTFGNGLNTIGNHAFDGCLKMDSINIPNASNLNAIGAYAFKDCQSLTSFTVTNSVTHIGDGAFKGCWNIENIKLIDDEGISSLAYMGSYVFQKCEKLKSITFPKIYSETIELSMFEDCKALQWIRSENSQFKIVKSTTCDFDWAAFKLGVTENFYIEGPDTNASDNSTIHQVCTENEVAFKYLDKDLYELTKKETGTGNPTVTYQVDSSQTLKEVKFNGTVTTLEFPDYIGPYSIQTIGADAFKDHCSLEKITIASTIEEIGDRAFQGCHNLKYVYFNTNKVKIGTDAFRTQEVTNHVTGCATKTTMTKDDNTPLVPLSFIGTISADSTPYQYAMSYAGRYNTGSQALSFINYLSGWPNLLTVKYHYDTETGKGYSELVDFPTTADSATYAIKDYLSDDQKKAATDALKNSGANSTANLTLDQKTFLDALKSLTIPTGVDAIEDGLFYKKTKDLGADFPVSCSGLTTIETGYKLEDDGVTIKKDKYGFPIVDPEKSDFAGCVNLSKIEILGDTTQITEGAFTGDTGLTTVQINGGVVTIGNHAFQGCTNLENVSISPTLQTLGIRPFAGCKKLTNVDFQGSSNFVCDNSIIYGLTDGNKTKLIELLESREIYIDNKNDSIDKITTIEAEAFEDTNVRKIDLSTSGATVIPERAFMNTTKLREVYLPTTSSHLAIENDAFNGSTVEDIKGGQNVNSIALRSIDGTKLAGLEGIVVDTSSNTTNTTNDTTYNKNVTIYTPESTADDYCYLYEYAVRNNFKVLAVEPEYYYTVTFRDWNEELGQNVIVGESQHILRGESATPPTPAGKEGYVFDKWDPDYKEIYEDVTITAQYKTAPEGYGQHLVTYVDYDDSVYATEYVSDGADAKMDFKEPTRTGYTFTGWTGKLTNITADTTVYANYNEGYLLRYYYYDDDGERQLFYSTYVSDGESGPALESPTTKAGYSFTGWMPSTSNIHEPTDTYAQYVPDGTSGLYTVNYYSYDGTLIDSCSVAEGGTAPNIAAPARAGYTFTGWLPSLTNVTSDRDVVANYTAGSSDGTTGTGTNGSTSQTYYVLTVKNGSGSGSYIAGSKPIVVADDPSSGQEFSTWSVDPSDTEMSSKTLSAAVVTMPSANVTVTANYKAKSGSSSGSGSTGSSNSTRVPTTTGTIKSGGTTVVIDKNGLSNTGVVSATVNGSSDNFTIKVSESSSASESAVKALMAEYGDLNSIKYFPMDITLYDSTGQNKITDTTGLSITITLPLPDSLAQYAGNNKIASVANDKLETLTPKFTTISGVPCITFTAEHFSPYVIYVDTNNLTAGTMTDSTPKTGDGIHPKWFLSVGLACISVVLFMKKDKKTTGKGLVKA